MTNYRSTLYQINKILDYMIILAKLKPNETLNLSNQERNYISNYFNNKQNFYEFHALIASVQFLNNYDDNNTFPSIDILKDLFDNGIISYYDESNDFIQENYNNENHKGIEITKDNLKGRPDEYQRKFKIIRNAIAHSDYKIEDGQIVIDWDYGKNLGEEFSIKLDMEAFFCLTEVLTEKRFSKEPIDEIGYTITPSHYVSIDSENSLTNILPLSMRKININGSLSEEEKEDVKDQLNLLLYKHVQNQRAININLRLDKGEKRNYRVNDKYEMLDMTNAFLKTSADLNYKVKFKNLKSKDPEIRYLKKYLRYYGDSFYKYGCRGDFTDKVVRINKNRMLLEILLLDSKDRLNINYSSFNLRELLLTIKKDEIKFEEFGAIRYLGLASLKNILIPKSQLIFEQLRKNEQNIKIDNSEIFEFLKSSSLKIKRNNENINLFSSKSSLGKQLGLINKKSSKLSDIEKYHPENLEKYKQEIDDLHYKAYNTLDNELFSHIRNSITHRHMEFVQDDQDIKLIFKDFKNEDSIPDNQKRKRNLDNFNNEVPDFYCEIELEDYLKLCDYISEIHFKEEDKLYFNQKIEGEKINKRMRFFTLSPYKPIGVRKLFNERIVRPKDCTNALANYTLERVKQHMKDSKLSMLTTTKF